MKFNVKNSASVSEIYIYGDIRDDSWNWGWEDDPDVYPLEIKNLLQGCNGEPVIVHINSGGGDFFAGMAISNILKHYSGQTTAYVDGLAASAASLIAFGCNKIVIPSNAYMMIHKPSSSSYGNADDFQKTADWLNKLQEGMVSLYSESAKVDADEINKLINDETWFTGTDALTYFDKCEIADALPVFNCVETAEKWAKTPQNLEEIRQKARENRKNTPKNRVETGENTPKNSNLDAKDLAIKLALLS